MTANLARPPSSSPRFRTLCRSSLWTDVCATIVSPMPERTFQGPESTVPVVGALPPSFWSCREHFTGLERTKCPKVAAAAGTRRVPEPGAVSIPSIVAKRSRERSTRTRGAHAAFPARVRKHGRRAWAHGCRHDRLRSPGSAVSSQLPALLRPCGSHESAREAGWEHSRC